MVADKGPNLPFETLFCIKIAVFEDSYDKKCNLYNQVVVSFLKKIFCHFGKCLYFCTRFSGKERAENDLLAQLV